MRAIVNVQIRFPRELCRTLLANVGLQLDCKRKEREKERLGYDILNYDKKLTDLHSNDHYQSIFIGTGTEDHNNNQGLDRFTRMDSFVDV